MALPTKSEWSTLKSNAGIAKAPWYKTADAAVGPALDAVASAKAKWNAKPVLDSAVSYATALEKLSAAFKKFVQKKDLAAAGTLGTKIAGWEATVTKQHDAVVKLLPALKAKDQAAVQEGIKAINPFIT